jgi:hypothetical protein
MRYSSDHKAFATQIINDLDAIISTVRNKTKPIKSLRKKSFEESKDNDLSIIEEIKLRLNVLAR